MHLRISVIALKAQSSCAKTFFFYIILFILFGFYATDDVKNLDPNIPAKVSVEQDIELTLPALHLELNMKGCDVNFYELY